MLLKLLPYWKTIWLISAVLFCVVVGLSFFGRVSWFLDLLTHFRVQYAIGLAIFFLGALAHRQWRLLSILFFFFIINSVHIVKYIAPQAKSSDQTDQSATVMFANVHYNVNESAGVVKFIQEHDPDIVAFAEINRAVFNEVVEAIPEYKFNYYQPATKAFDLAVMSKEKPSQKMRVYYYGQTESPTLEVTYGTDTATFRLYIMHTHAPTSAEYQQFRNLELLGIARTVSGSTVPTLVVGDLNATSWTEAFDSMLEVGGLRDSRRGLGVAASWPAWGPGVIRIPIDHALVNSYVTVKDRTVGAADNSDHLPILVEIGW